MTMRTLSDKSIEKLELPAVLELLAGQAASADGKERCRAVRPETDLDEVRLLQAQTSAACHLITLKGSPSLSGAKDVSDALLRADRGGSLSAGELLKIAAVLRCARQVKNYAETDSVS